MNRRFYSSGFAQIPLIIGLLLMAVAIPAATKLVQENSDTRNRAAGICPAEHGEGGCGIPDCCRSWEVYENGCCKSTSGCRNHSDCGNNKLCVEGVCQDAPKPTCDECSGSGTKCENKLYKFCDGACWREDPTKNGICSPTNTPVPVAPTAKPVVDCAVFCKPYEADPEWPLCMNQCALSGTPDTWKCIPQSTKCKDGVLETCAIDGSKYDKASKCQSGCASETACASCSGQCLAVEPPASDGMGIGQGTCPEGKKCYDYVTTRSCDGKPHNTTECAVGNDSFNQCIDGTWWNYKCTDDLKCPAGGSGCVAAVPTRTGTGERCTDKGGACKSSCGQNDTSISGDFWDCASYGDFGGVSYESCCKPNSTPTRTGTGERCTDKGGACKSSCGQNDTSISGDFWDCASYGDFGGVSYESCCKPALNCGFNNRDNGCDCALLNSGLECTSRYCDADGKCAPKPALNCGFNNRDNGCDCALLNSGLECTSRYCDADGKCAPKPDALCYCYSSGCGGTCYPKENGAARYACSDVEKCGSTCIASGNECTMNALGNGTCKEGCCAGTGAFHIDGIGTRRCGVAPTTPACIASGNECTLNAFGTAGTCKTGCCAGTDTFYTDGIGTRRCGVKDEPTATVTPDACIAGCQALSDVARVRCVDGCGGSCPCRTGETRICRTEVAGAQVGTEVCLALGVAGNSDCGDWSGQCVRDEYGCNKQTGKCEKVNGGGYYDEAVCNQSCDIESRKYYGCNEQTGVCSESPTGRYTDVNQCTNNCRTATVPPTQPPQDPTNPPATSTTKPGPGPGGATEPPAPAGCYECPNTFQCYQNQNGTDYKWFVTGYVMNGYVKVTGESQVLRELKCNQANVPKPTFKGKARVNGVKGGDANCDGYVNGDDYSIWRKEYTDGLKTNNRWEADFSCKNEVDNTDYSTWRTSSIDEHNDK